MRLQRVRISRYQERQKAGIFSRSIRRRCPDEATSEYYNNHVRRRLSTSPVGLSRSRRARPIAFRHGLTDFVTLYMSLRECHRRLDTLFGPRQTDPAAPVLFFGDLSDKCFALVTALISQYLACSRPYCVHVVPCDLAAFENLL